jgi:hypothetical protein
LGQSVWIYLLLHWHALMEGGARPAPCHMSCRP